MSTVERFGVSMDASLLDAFDQQIKQAGYKNRSEAVRDLVRDYLVRQEWKLPQTTVVGTITLVYDHHTSDIEHHLTHLQHEHTAHICCNTHVHLDEHNCIEVIIVQGPGAAIRSIADQLIASRGVKHGQLVCTTTGAEIV